MVQFVVHTCCVLRLPVITMPRYPFLLTVVRTCVCTELCESYRLWFKSFCCVLGLPKFNMLVLTNKVSHILENNMTCE